jgi:hypothetical protein
LRSKKTGAVYAIKLGRFLLVPAIGGGDEPLIGFR